MPEPPAAPLTRLTAAAVAPAFGLLSALRGGRALHPQGLAVTGTLHPAGPGLPGLPGTAEGTPVLARLSRGIGLPQALPDVLGLALRILGAHGPGRDQDLLLATSGTGTLGRHVFLPARDHLHATYSSVAPYLVEGRRVTVLAGPPQGERRTARTLGEIALAAGGEGVRFDLVLAGAPEGVPRTIGRVLLDGVLPDAEAARLSFDVRHHGPGFRPVSPVNALRPAAYAASRRPSARSA